MEISVPLAPGAELLGARAGRGAADSRRLRWGSTQARPTPLRAAEASVGLSSRMHSTLGHLLCCEPLPLLRVTATATSRAGGVFKAFLKLTWS